MDVHQRPNPNGFRTGKTTTAYIFALKMLIEGVKSHYHIDFKKVFWTDVENSSAYDILPSLLKAIQKLYVVCLLKYYLEIH